MTILVHTLLLLLLCNLSRYDWLLASLRPGTVVCYVGWLVQPVELGELPDALSQLKTSLAAPAFIIWRLE